MNHTNQSYVRRESTLFVVLAEHTLGYVRAEQPASMQVLAGLASLGGLSPADGPVDLLSRQTETRLATFEDFRAFGVKPPSVDCLACPNPTPIVSECMRVGRGPYIATEGQDELVELAIGSFGHLIKSVALTRLSFAQFADAIEANYSPAEGRTREVLRTLRTLHLINSVVPAPHAELVSAARAVATRADAHFQSQLIRVYGERHAGDARYRYQHADPDVAAAAAAYKQASESYSIVLRHARDSSNGAHGSASLLSVQ